MIFEPMQTQDSNLDEQESGKPVSLTDFILNESVSEEPISQDLDLSIALIKATRKCVQHPLYPISQFVSLHHLSLQHKNFLTTLDSIDIPKTIQEALKDKNWTQAMKEEMTVLEKNKT